MWALVSKDFVSGLCYEDVIFDSDAELAGDVYAGLDCDYLAGFEFALAIGFEEWVFVYFQAEAVSRSVAVNGQVGFFNHLSGGGVDLCDFHAGSNCFYRRGLGLLYGVIDSFVKSSNPANHEAPSNIAAITFILGAEVDQDGIFYPELSGAGLMMRPGTVRAESDDGLETVSCP